MEQSQKKKRRSSDAIAGLIFPQSFEFETRLTTEECAENLQRLLNPSEFVSAKSRAKMANRGFITKISWVDEQCGFIVETPGRYDQAVIKGSVFHSEVYEATLVRGESTGIRETEGVSALILSVVLLGGLSLVAIGAGGWQMLCVLVMLVFSIFSLTMARYNNQRNLISLIQDVLTDEEELVWRRSLLK